MSEQEALYRSCELGTGEYWAREHAPTPAEKLAAMRAAILALAARMERPMPGLGNGDVAKELRRIAG